MLNENRLYSISLGVASLQDGLVGVATALSPAMAGHFKFLLHHFFVRLGLILSFYKITKAGECYAGASPMSRTWACGPRHRGGRIHRRKFYESPDPDPHIQSARRLFLRPRRYLSDPRLGI